MKLNHFAAVLILLISLTSCIVKHHNDDLYVVYEETTVYTSADENADVLTTIKPNNTQVIRIDKYKNNNTFGRIFNAKDTAKWINLEDINRIAPCGKQEDKNKYEIAVVQPKKLALYSAPVKGKGRKLEQTLSQGDTVLVLVNHEGAAHIQFASVDKKGHSELYGWVLQAEENLQTIGKATKERFAMAATQRFSEEQYQIERKHTGEMYLDYKPMAVLHKITKIMVWVLAVISLILGVYLWFLSDNESGHIAWPTMLILGIVLLIFAYNTHNPHWAVALAPVLFCLPLYFPLVRTKIGGWLPYSYAITAAAWVITYTIFYLNAHHVSGAEWWLSVLIYFFLDFALLTAIVLVEQKLESRVCPKCGFYGHHEQVGTTQRTSSSSSVGREEHYDHSETHGNKRVDYYNQGTYKTTDTTIDTDHHMECCRCGYHFTYTTSVTNTSKSRVD